MNNASTILTCVGAAGVVATTVLTVKATIKLPKVLEKAEEQKGEDLTALETVLMSAPVCIPPIATGLATITCIFSANALNKRKQASLVGAYALLDTSFRQYKSKVKDLCGNDVDREIVAEIAKDNYKESEIVTDNKQLFYDSFSMRYFEATMEDVLKAENETKIEFTHEKTVMEDGLECTIIDIPLSPFADYLDY